MTTTTRLMRRVTSAHAASPAPVACLPTLVTTFLMAIGITACSNPAPSAPEPFVRVIVRFRPAVLDPLDPAFLAKLAEQSRVTRIEAIRPMSGDAFVLQVTCADPQSPHIGDPCVSALARLRASQVVLALDVDRREKHQ